MNKLTLPPQEKQIIFEFKSITKKLLGKDFVSVQLFGSYARGNWKKDSDIDLLILVKKRTPQVEEKIYRNIVELLIEKGIYLSVKVFELKEFQKLDKLPSVFLQSFKQEAITV